VPQAPTNEITAVKTHYRPTPAFFFLWRARATWQDTHWLTFLLHYRVIGFRRNIQNRLHQYSNLINSSNGSINDSVDGKGKSFVFLRKYIKHIRLTRILERIGILPQYFERFFKTSGYTLVWHTKHYRTIATTEMLLCKNDFPY